MKIDNRSFQLGMINCLIEEKLLQDEPADPYIYGES
jgi:hypothetical protein